MSYSVVILSRSTANLIPCVEAIRRNEPDLPVSQIIVVDDDETGKIAEFCDGEGLTRIVGEKPFIFARNANLGLVASFKYCTHAVLLNDDALLSKRRGFAAMVSAQRLALPEFGLVASSCNNVGNPNQHPRGAAFIRREARMLCFVCVLIPRSTWETVGPLDERYTGYGCDDDDYSLQVRKAGLKLGVFDGCFVDHGTLKSTYRGGGGGDFRGNLEIFKQKWGHDNFGRAV